MNDVLAGLVKDIETFLIPLTSISLKLGKLLKYIEHWVCVCSCMCTCICIFKCPLFQGQSQVPIRFAVARYLLLQLIPVV